MPDDAHLDPQPETATKLNRQNSRHWLSPEDWKAANDIADQLNETEAQARRQVVTIVKHMGLEFANEVLQETLKVEAAGGMMLADGSRRRTPGGVFFYLARKRIPVKLRYQMFPHTKSVTSPSKQKASKEIDFIAWADRQNILAPLLQESGTARNVKAVLIGVPQNLKSQQGYVTFKLTGADKTPTLPRGVPMPEFLPTPYMVYVSARHWKRVEEAATDPDDMLIIEGTCAYNEQIKGMAFYTTNITSKRLESKKREQRVDESHRE